MSYPVYGKDKIYKKGISLVFDSFAHTNQKDITAVRDSMKMDMYESGKLEHEDTPVDGLDQPKLLIHNKNEIPLFFGPNKIHLTIDRYSGLNIGEIKVLLKVSVKITLFLYMLMKI